MCYKTGFRLLLTEGGVWVSELQMLSVRGLYKQCYVRSIKDLCAPIMILGGGGGLNYGGGALVKQFFLTNRYYDCCIYLMIIGKGMVLEGEATFVIA